MNSHLIRRDQPYPLGYTPITRMGEPADTGIELGILKLGAGETKPVDSAFESAWLLLDGRVRVSFDGGEREVERRSLFDEDPYALHLPAGAPATLQALSECELAVSQTAAGQTFAPRLFDGETMLESEHRGRGNLDDTAFRIVRTIFDDRNRPEANLVLGEVVNFPGRWSSYPPHHHPQPEIYHYRFTEPQGYGHGELGEEVFKLRQYDTLKILNEKDHAQVAAPGYGMYYVWVIRHLPGDRYSVPEFTAAHRWTIDAGMRAWRPSVLEEER